MRLCKSFQNTLVLTHTTLYINAESAVLGRREGCGKCFSLENAERADRERDGCDKHFSCAVLTDSNGRCTRWNSFDLTTGHHTYVAL